MSTTTPLSPATGNPLPEWFAHDRFGMFVHWGLYSTPARHEWVMNVERIPAERYERYLDYFTADLFDPVAWAKAAKNAGMRYVVLTTKHHEGFALWDSKLTDYTVMHSPAGRDLVREFVDAVRAEGLRVGLYHSVIDWHHPQFPIDGLHPQRDDDAADIARVNEQRDIRVYADYLHGQVRELLTDYGAIDYLFFDFSYDETTPHRQWGGKGATDWRAEELLALVRELQPNIIVNDRLGIPGDIVTPEQYQPVAPMELDGVRVPWEACQTMDGSWGYHRDNRDNKTPDMLIRMLIDGVSNDGNLLLNVGPTARGVIDAEDLDTLAVIGEWMRFHEPSIRGAGHSDYVAPRDTRLTQRGNSIYVHVFAWPFGYLHVAGLAGQVKFVRFVHDGSELLFKDAPTKAQAGNTSMGGLPEGTLTIALPTIAPNVAVPVIEIILA